MEIFHLNDDNDSGELTVKSVNEDDLIAPGTSEEYSFTLENTGDVLLDYEMTMEAWVTGTELELPVKARVWDYNEKYLLGSVEEKADVLELNKVAESSKLSAGRYAKYTLEWEWPYEWDNDEYDTMLGNMAVDGDLALTIRINTIASYDEAVPEIVSSDTPAESRAAAQEYGLEGPADAPKTGVTLGIIPLVLTLALVIMIIARPSGRKDEAEDK